MKKIIILLMAAAMIFTACGNKDGAAKESASYNIAHEQTSNGQEVATSEPSAEAFDETEFVSAELPMFVAIALPMDRFAEAEFNPVIDAVINAGYMPIILGEETGMAMSSEETGVEVRDLFSDHSSEDLRGIIVIGGSDSLWENQELNALLKNMHENGRLTAAICLSSVTLAKAGIIGEGDSACWYNSKKADSEMESAGVADSGMDVTVDGLIITGDGPSSAEEFAQEIVTALGGM